MIAITLKEPKYSMDIIIAVNRSEVAPQKTPIIPKAATEETGNFKKVAIVLPNVAPTKKSWIPTSSLKN